MSNEDVRFLERICPECKVALLYPHDTLHNWVKCELCGFCKEIKK